MDLTQAQIQFVDTNGLRLAYRRMGSGPALILLHGFPQNGLCWETVAPELAQDFDVIVPDLRGYGESDAPQDTCPDHSTYSKREMAKDIIGLMDALNISTARVLGHDRGGRVAYRLALDHVDRVSSLGIIEIVPTGDFWDHWSADLALKAYHWTYLAQPYPFPERMIGADPVAFLDWTLRDWTKAKSLSVFSEPALESYRAQISDPKRLHAMCADYRSGASFDRAADNVSKANGDKLACPLKFLWATGGFPAQTGNPAALWQKWASNLEDTSCDSGHFVMEENPQAVLECFQPFFCVA